MSPVSALCDKYALIWLDEIVQQFAGVVVIHRSADGNPDLEIFTVMTTAIAAFAVPAALGTKGVIETEFQKRVFVGIGKKVDTAPVAAVTAARTAARDILFPSKGDRTMTAAAGFQGDFGFIDEHFIDGTKPQKSTKATKRFYTILWLLCFFVATYSTG